MTSPDDELPETVARLRNQITCELLAQLPLRSGSIRRDDVSGVAYAIAVRLSHMFRVEWAPAWDDEPADEDLISADSATWHAPA